MVVAELSIEMRDLDRYFDLIGKQIFICLLKLTNNILPFFKIFI